MPPRRFDKKKAVAFHLVPRPADGHYDADAPKYSLEPARAPGRGPIERYLPANFPMDIVAGHEHIDPSYERTYIRNSGPGDADAPRTAAMVAEDELLERLAQDRARGKSKAFAGWYGSRKEDEADTGRFGGDDGEGDGEGDDDWDEEQFADAEVIDMSDERRAAAKMTKAAVAAAAAAKAGKAGAQQEQEEDNEELPEIDEDDEEGSGAAGADEDTPAARAEMRGIARKALREFARRTGEHIEGLSDDDSDDDDADADEVDDDDDGEYYDEGDFEGDFGGDEDDEELDTELEEDEDEDGEEEEDGPAARAEMQRIARKALLAYARRTGEHIEGLSDVSSDDDEEEEEVPVRAPVKGKGKKAVAPALTAETTAAGVKTSAKTATKAAKEAAKAEKAAEKAAAKAAKKAAKRILPYSYDYDKHFRPITGAGQFLGQNGSRVDPEAEAPVVPAIAADDAEFTSAAASDRARALKAKHDAVVVSVASGLEIPVVAPGKGVKITSDFLEALEIGNEQGFLDLEDNFYELAMMEPEEADKVLEEKQRAARAKAAEKHSADVVAKVAAEKKRRAQIRAAREEQAQKRAAAAAARRKRASGGAGGDEDEEEDDDEALHGSGGDDGFDSGSEDELVIDDAGNIFPAGADIAELSDEEDDDGAAALHPMYDDEEAFFGDGDMADELGFDPLAYLQTGAIAKLRDELAAVGGSEALKEVTLPAGLSERENQQMLEKMQLMTLLEEYDDDDDENGEGDDGGDDGEEDEDEDEDYGDEDEDEDADGADAEAAAERRRRRAARAAHRRRRAPALTEDENGLSINPDGMEVEELAARFREDIDEVMGLTRRHQTLKTKRDTALSEDEILAARAASLAIVERIEARAAVEEADSAAVGRAIDAQFVPRVKEKWDAESIVSTYSDTNNIPVLIREARVRAGGKGKIKLTRDGDMPAGMLKKHRDEMRTAAEKARAEKKAAAAAASGLTAVAEDDEAAAEAAAEAEAAAAAAAAAAKKAQYGQFVEEEDTTAAGRAAAKAKAAAASGTHFTSLAPDAADEEDEDEDESEYEDVVNKGAKRNKGESKDEKRARKAAIKSEKAAARARKKTTKTLFTQEQQTQVKMSAQNKLGRASVQKFF